jgi:hypothetical protein
LSKGGSGQATGVTIISAMRSRLRDDAWSIESIVALPESIRQPLAVCLCQGRLCQTTGDDVPTTFPIS